MASYAQPEAKHRATRAVPGASQQAAGQCPGSLKEYRIIKGCQGLQRRIGPDSSHSTDFTAWRVECHKARIGRRATPKRIYTTPVTILAMARNPLVVIVRQVPDPFGLIWKD